MLLLFLFLSIDGTLFDYINSDLKCPTLDCLNNGIGVLSSQSSLFATHFLLFSFGRERERAVGKLALLSASSATFLSLGIKTVVNRPRPEGKRGRLDSSFPSTHSAQSSALAFVYGQKYPKLKIFFYTYSLFVGFSRVYSGEHYPSDVLVGWVLGYLTARLVLRAEREIVKFFESRIPSKERFWGK